MNADEQAKLRLLRENRDAAVAALFASNEQDQPFGAISIDLKMRHLERELLSNERALFRAVADRHEANFSAKLEALFDEIVPCDFDQEIVQPPEIKTKMRRYQLRAAKWMWMRERGEFGTHFG